MGASARESMEERAARRADDRRLLERFFSGDDAGLVELYDRHHLKLYIYCEKIVGSAEQAEDIVQEMWERVSRLRASRPSIDNPLGLFFRIIRNLSINYKQTLGRLTSLNDLDESSHPVTTLHEPSRREEIVGICLERLRPEGRQILILNLYAGYRHDEIADMLGKSHDAIRKQASRAQAELRDLVVELLRNESSEGAGRQEFPGKNDGRKR